jgi:hypothetical protein
MALSRLIEALALVKLRLTRTALRLLSTVGYGETEFILEGRGNYRGKRCRAERVAQRRRDVKATLVAEAGGRCVICGYSRCAAALEFHHVDPNKKLFEVNANGATVSIDMLRTEAKKCVLLCSNCHAEVENGVTRLSLE